MSSSASSGSTGRSTSASSGGRSAHGGGRICRHLIKTAVQRHRDCTRRRMDFTRSCVVMTKAERNVNLIGVVLPFLGMLVAIVLLWNKAVDAADLILLAVLYLIGGFGITVGFHRMLTHRAFQTSKP